MLYNFTKKTKVSCYKRSPEKEDCHVFTSQRIIEFRYLSPEVKSTSPFSFRENKGIMLYSFTKTGGDDSSSLIEFTPL